MANRGRQEFSVQEAVNMDAFGDFNYQEIEMTDETANTVTAVTGVNPAKKVVFYDKPGSSSATFDATDVLTITANSKTLKIDATDLPFTLSGLLLTSLTITSSAGESSDFISVLSFH